jgi:glycosyltransferase involved in cell wall biosynthesis
MSLQARIKAVFGSRIERYYETFKYGLDFIRFRRPIYKAIRQKIESVQPDLVHFNNGVGTDTPGILAARKYKVPAVCHIRTLAKLTHINVAASRSVDAFLCISNAVRDRAVNQGVNAERSIVVPNAVDLSRFNSTDDVTQNIRDELGWDDSHKIFSLVGRVVSWKGQDYFIRAIAEAYESDKAIRGLIVGDVENLDTRSSYLDDLRSLVGDLGLDEIVMFTGQRMDVPDIMRSSDIVVCASSLPEPFGRVIIEGMAAGAVVIATEAGGALDIIENEFNGLLVPVKDSHALARAMLRLCEEPPLLERLRSAATDVVRDKYTVNKHVDLICEIYRSVINEG